VKRKLTIIGVLLCLVMTGCNQPTKDAPVVRQVSDQELVQILKQELSRPTNWPMAIKVAAPKNYVVFSDKSLEHGLKALLDGELATIKNTRIVLTEKATTEAILAADPEMKAFLEKRALELPTPITTPSPTPTTISTPALTAPSPAIQQSPGEIEGKLAALNDEIEQVFRALKDQLGKVNSKAEDSLRLAAENSRRLNKIEKRPIQTTNRPSSEWSYSYILLCVAVFMLSADRVRQWWQCRQNIIIHEMADDKSDTEIETAHDETPVEKAPPPVRPIISPPTAQRGVPPIIKPPLPKRPTMVEPSEEQ
jgi:hypothetical protein